MNAVLLATDAIPPVNDRPAVPFATVYVTLTKQEHIQLVMDANTWKGLHRKATERAEWSERRHQHELRRAAEVAVSGELRHQEEMREFKDQAGQREAALRAQLEVAHAKVRDLRKRLFGRKSESRGGGTEDRGHAPVLQAPRGHRVGAAGHGRTMQSLLPERVELVELDDPQCPSCGLDLREFPGTEDSQVLEIEVQAYRRVIRRRRYRPVCNCACVPGIVTAPPPSRLIERGKYGVSVWTTVVLDKFLYGRPSHRLLQDLADHGLRMSPGTLAGGLQAIAPLFKPLDQALLAKLRSEKHWHADETRWAVFVTVEGKVGHRWYLWVFHSPSMVHYVLDPSRATKVVQGELDGVASGIISCDRYSAYKKFARLNPGVLLAFCWAHQRRDYLDLANAHPHLVRWAFAWVDAIGELYRLNDLRLQAMAGSAERAQRHAQLQQAVQRMSAELDAALADPTRNRPAAKVLQSMKNHWSGLTVFVEHPWVPMDNNVAERAARLPVVGRKNFYGSGSEWSGQLAAAMYSALMTVKLWGLNARTWLSAYLQACADNGNQAPQDIGAFLPWAMDAARLAAMRAGPTAAGVVTEGIDTS
jgi:transposase